MSKKIHISHFINPYCFYFKFDDGLHDNSLQLLENEVSNYARAEISRRNGAAQPISIDDTVAAFEISWGKWVRAIVRSNVESHESYELWAIDHGRIFQTAYANVVSLPEHLANETAKMIHRGSVYGLAPAQLVSLHWQQ